MTEPMTRRERKKLATRQQLVAAAGRLIGDAGVSELRIADITAEADVALGTFYSYFETKDDLVEAVLSDVVEPVTDAIAAYGDQVDDPAVAAAVGVREVLALCDADHGLARLLVRLQDAEARFERMMRPRVQPVVERGVASGRFRVGAHDAEAAAEIAIATVFALIRSRLDRPSAPEPVEDAVFVLQLLGIDHDDALAVTSADLPEPLTVPGSSRDRLGRPGSATGEDLVGR